MFRRRPKFSPEDLENKWVARSNLTNGVIAADESLVQLTHRLYGRIPIGGATALFNSVKTPEEVPASTDAMSPEATCTLADTALSTEILPE